MEVPSWEQLQWQVSSDLVSEARRKNALKLQNGFKGFMDALCGDSTNPLLNSLVSVSGCTRDIFLHRLTSIPSFVHTGGSQIARIIDRTVRNLSPPQDRRRTTDAADAEDSCASSAEETVTVSNSRKYELLRKLCELAESRDCLPTLIEWCELKSGDLCDMISHNLTLENPSLAIEACVCIAFLARKLRLHLFKGIQLVIATMVRVIAIAMLPLESHTRRFRLAQEEFADAQLVSVKPLTFHFASMSGKFHECRHRLVGFCYYAIADLTWSIPHPKLLHCFLCRILRRKEMTRLCLFQILASIVECIPELRCEAEHLTKTFQLLRQQNPFFNQNTWNELPATMHSELLLAYKDSNHRNEHLIKGMLQVLESYGGINSAVFDVNLPKSPSDLVRRRKPHKDIGGDPKPSKPKTEKTLVISFGIGSSHLIEIDAAKDSDAENTTRDSERESNLEGDVDDDCDYCDSCDSLESGSNGRLRRSTLEPDALPKYLSFPYCRTNAVDKQQ